MAGIDPWVAPSADPGMVYGVPSGNPIREIMHRQSETFDPRPVTQATFDFKYLKFLPS